MAQVWQGHDAEAYETPTARIGRKGLNLVDAIDDLDVQELARLVNMVSRFGGMLETRPGQTALATTTGTDHVHSLSRLNDPANSTFTRLGGSSTNVYRGQSGALTLIDSNYSGDPLTFAEASAPLTGVPYTLIGDRSRNRKVARTGVVELIGAVAPTNAPSVVTAAENTTSICRFDSQDSTDAAAWTETAGTDTAGAATGAPVAADSGDTVTFTTDATGGGAGLGYFSVVSIAKSIDLSTLQGGLYDATDDDLMNFRFRIDRPDLLEEIRVYFVCSAFTAGVIPGTSATQNVDAFWKSFKPSDFSTYLDLLGKPASESVATLGDNLRDKVLREEFKSDRGTDDTRLTSVNQRAQTELYRTSIFELGPGRNRETVTGVVGNPLRRGDFSRIGTDAAATWATLTGIVIVIRTNTNSAVVVTCDDWRMTGGGGPDTTPIGYQPYDFRFTHWNPATGVESNPSPVMDESLWLDALRQPISVNPPAGSSVATTWRQKFYRRGGSPQTSDNWYYDGMNSSDGGTYETYRSDDELFADGTTLQIDNYQPVPSVDSAGATVLAKAVPIFFRVGLYMFALGDANQPQRLYRSKRGNADAWPADEYEDVVGGSEELMNGCEWGVGGFVFSRKRMYGILTNDLEDTWTTEPTACTEGLVGRWAMCWTPYGVAFVSPFGVRLTTGGVPSSLSDEQIGPIFRGETIHGFNPIDFTVPTALKLAYHDHELWFTYQDQTGGDRRQIIYNFFDKSWRSYLFGEEVSCVYSEPVQGAAASLIMGGFATGQIYTHSGFSDDGAAIAYTARTGAWDFGDPAVEKLLTQIIVDAELETSSLTCQAFLNNEVTSVTAQTVTGVAGLRRYSFEPFGTAPQRARNVSVELRGNAPTDNKLQFNLLGVTRKMQPEIVFNQPTPWEELPGGEGYLWGCIITCDTGNVARTVEVEYTTVNGSITSAASLSVTADGRKKIPFSWSAVLAHQVRLRPTGSCVEWIRYKIEWLVDPEPVRVNKWDTNWEDFGSLTDKWIKGYLIEADTFNAAKTVVLDSVDSDGAQNLAVNSLSLTRNGRGVYHHSFSKIRGRLFRLRSTDSNYGKLYRWQPIFDEEPLALARWESQETDHGRHGWQKPLEAWVTLRSSATVTLTVTARGEDGTDLDTSQYTIATTGGAKRKRRVPFNPSKGVLYTYVFTCASAFWLYREESEVLVEEWASGQTFTAPIFGNDDRMVPPRAMGNSAGAAATPNPGA